MADGYSIRVFQATDLPRLQEITVQTFGRVSIDRNIEQMLGAFGQGDWRSRKVMAIADDCAAQPDGVTLACENGGGQDQPPRCHTLPVQQSTYAPQSE